MTDYLDLHAISSSQTEPAVITAMPGAVGAHVGIRYVATDDGEQHHVHLAFHHELRDENASDIDPRAIWVSPRLSASELSDVATAARLIAARHSDGRVPYAFGLDGQYFNEESVLDLKGALGLTCATFVILVFRHAKIELVEETTWDQPSAERQAEDERAHSILLGYLRNRDPPHAKQVEERGIECTRIRSEEVAAASGLKPQPVAFDRAAPAGRAVLERIAAPSS